MGWAVWIEVFVRMKKSRVARSGGGGGGGGQGGCERRFEDIVKMKIYSSFFIS